MVFYINFIEVLLREDETKKDRNVSEFWYIVFKNEMLILVQLLDFYVH